MSQNVYKELLEVMRNRGGPYSGLDIPEFYALVEDLFTPEEAEINNVLARKPAAAEDIAGRINRDKNEVTRILREWPIRDCAQPSKVPARRSTRGYRSCPASLSFSSYPVEKPSVTKGLRNWSMRIRKPMSLQKASRK